ncbi:MAG: M64 family metallopeptidase [Prevotella sp.]
MRIFLTCLLAIVTLTGRAQQTFDNFRDSTLRLDYIFSGNIHSQHIALDEIKLSPRWYGKRHRLAEVPIEGNGQIIVCSHATGDTLYVNSFCTLFQEWLSYPEAETSTRSFENVFLIPMPRDTVDVTVRLTNSRREEMARLTHTVIPSDILIRHMGYARRTPYVTLQTAADTLRSIKIAFVAEGYQKGEMDTFLADAREAADAIFSHEPFRSSSSRFSLYAVMSPSADSGTSEPARGKWLDTALHSNFNTFYSDRYLTTLRLKDLHDILAGIPYEHIIVLVNTSNYGGGGILNSYNLSMTHHASFRPVVVHEFGHSFAGLADEYAYEEEAIPMYPHDVEPWEQNITTLADFTGKWENLIAPGTPVPTPLSDNPDTIMSRVGIFEGAGYSMHGVYRGTQDCRMRTNLNPEFCPVCRQAIQRVIDFYTR